MTSFIDIDSCSCNFIIFCVLLTLPLFLILTMATRLDGNFKKNIKKVFFLIGIWFLILPLNYSAFFVLAFPWLNDSILAVSTEFFLFKTAWLLFSLSLTITMLTLLDNEWALSPIAGLRYYQIGTLVCLLLFFSTTFKEIVSILG